MDGTFIHINQAFADIIGHTIEDALKLTYWEITPEKYKEQEKIQMELLLSTDHYGPYEKEYIKRMGILFPYCSLAHSSRGVEKNSSGQVLKTLQSTNLPKWSWVLPDAA